MKLEQRLKLMCSALARRLFKISYMAALDTKRWRQRVASSMLVSHLLWLAERANESVKEQSLQLENELGNVKDESNQAFCSCNRGWFDAVTLRSLAAVLALKPLDKCETSSRELTPLQNELASLLWTRQSVRLRKHGARPELHPYDPHP